MSRSTAAVIRGTMPDATDKKPAERLDEVQQAQFPTDDSNATSSDTDKLTQDLEEEIGALASLAERKRLNATIELVQRSNKEARIETTIRLAHATNWLLNGFISVRKESMTFAEFKAALRPEQARRMAMNTMQMGATTRLKNPELKDAPDTPYLTELAFYLLAVSLHAKAGADWVDSEVEESIDSLIAKSVLFLEKSRTGMPAPTKTKTVEEKNAPLTASDFLYD